jgi:prepilin peptidase CpaA
MTPDLIQSLPKIALLAILAILLVRAAIGDAKRYIIPNTLCLTIAAFAPLYWLACTGADGPAFAHLAVNQLLIAGCAFLPFFGLFCWGKMGGGDVKMITAIAFWTPAFSLLQWLLIMSLAGGALALISLIAIHGFGQKRRFFAVRYGVAIALGGMVFIGEPFLKTFSG